MLSLLLQEVTSSPEHFRAVTSVTKELLEEYKGLIKQGPAVKEPCKLQLLWQLPCSLTLTHQELMRTSCETQLRPPPCLPCPPWCWWLLHPYLQPPTEPCWKPYSSSKALNMIHDPGTSHWKVLTHTKHKGEQGTSLHGAHSHSVNTCATLQLSPRIKQSFWCAARSYKFSIKKREITTSLLYTHTVLSQHVICGCSASELVWLSAAGNTLVRSPPKYAKSNIKH